MNLKFFKEDNIIINTFPKYILESGFVFLYYISPFFCGVLFVVYMNPWFIIPSILPYLFRIYITIEQKDRDKYKISKANRENKDLNLKDYVEIRE